ncbi:MAG: cbb3-type cytochrome c oxidase subunit II [bacterium]|nr:cbb3-type cytochrome c oxidase subunit II [bacterium]
MSDLLAAASAALGAPDHLVERAAQARAEADGTTYEEVLAAWGGGAPLPAPSATPEPPTPPISSGTPATPPPSAAPEPVPAAPAPAPRPAAPALSKATPRLAGVGLHPLRTWVMMAGLFVIGLVITLIGPYNTGGDFRHLVPDAPLSVLGTQGRAVYSNQGCSYCHTQLVRPVLADVGLGPVTENWADSLDTATFGVQRIGPDLAHVGNRAPYGGDAGTVTVDDLMILLSTPGNVFASGNHPSYAHLSDHDLTALATYLSELK